MITNLSEIIKKWLFKKIELPKKSCIISDAKIETDIDFVKIDTLEPVWQILALTDRYDFIFVILDRLNYDNIYRLYKNDRKNICVLNLNSGYTWLWIKSISPDLDDIYVKENVQVLEPMDLENLKFNILEFIENPFLTHIRVSNKEMEEKVWWDEANLEYKEIINFNEFGLSWFSGTVLVYGSMLQEWLNAVWLLKWEGIWVDMFWLWNYKNPLSVDLVNSLESQDKVFIVGDFSDLIFKDFIYSKLYSAWVNKEEIYFITPTNFKQVFNDVLAEQVEMTPVKIYEKIRKQID